MDAPTPHHPRTGQSPVADGILLPLHMYQGRFLHGAMFGLVFAVAFVFASFAAAAPVTVDVTVTGADGNPAPNATVTVTKAGSNPHDPAARTGSATTGTDGSASVSGGTVLPSTRSQPLEPGVYRVDVAVDGKLTTTYVHVPDGQTGDVTVDLRTATTIDPRGESYDRAARNAEASKDRGDQAGYDRSVRRIDQIIEHPTQAVEDLEGAPAGFNEPRTLRPRSPVSLSLAAAGAPSTAT